MTYVRGAYNAMTPFHKWHAVRNHVDGVYTTFCGLPYYNTSFITTAPSKAALSGDKCDTIACGLKGE